MCVLFAKSLFFNVNIISGTNANTKMGYRDSDKNKYKDQIQKHSYRDQ